MGELFAQNVLRRRQELNLTQTNVGDLAGVHRATIRALEVGKTVETKTRINVLRSLGCVPSLADDVWPIFSAGLAEGTARAILQLHGDDRASAISDYFEVVTAVAELPASPDVALSEQIEAVAGRLRAALDSTMSAARLRDFDAEMGRHLARQSDGPTATAPAVPSRSTVVTELAAIEAMVAEMGPLGPGPRRRALAYLNDRYGDGGGS